MALPILEEDITAKIEPISRSRPRTDLNLDVVDPLRIAHKALQKLAPTLAQRVAEILDAVTS